MKRVLIADDHALVRKGLEMIIRSAFGPCKITTAINGEEVFHYVQQQDFDLAVLDLNMPNTDAIALFQQIMLFKPGLQVLICSMNPEKIFALRYLKLGAAGYVEKSEEDEVLEKAIRTVINGRKYFSDDVMDQITLSMRGKNPENPFYKLTDREFEIAMHLIRGLSVGEIAGLIHLHTSTVGTQRAKVLEKTGVQNVMELNKLARIHKIID